MSTKIIPASYFNFISAYVHVRDGKLVGGKISQHSCHASFTIFSPIDHTLRKAIIIPAAGRPHNHPSFPMHKLTYEAKLKYESAVQETGTIGATVQKVDNGTVSNNLHYILVSYYYYFVF